jgi:hypothetical protein
LLGIVIFDREGKFLAGSGFHAAHAPRPQDSR